MYKLRRSARSASSAASAALISPMNKVRRSAASAALKTPVNELRRSARNASSAASAALITPKRKRNATRLFSPMEAKTETVVVGKMGTRKRKMVDTSVSNKRRKTEDTRIKEEVKDEVMEDEKPAKEEFIVDKIVTHCIASEVDFEACDQEWKGSEDEIAFKVKWRGTRQVTWEPLRNLCDNVQLEQYMCENLIPTIGRAVGTHRNRIKVSFVYIEPFEDQWYYLDGLYEDEVPPTIARTTHTKQTAVRTPKLVAPIPKKPKPAKKPRNAQKGQRITQSLVRHEVDPTDLFGGAPYADDLEEPFTYTTDRIFQTVDATPVLNNRKRGRVAKKDPDSETTPNPIPVATRGNGRKAASRNAVLEAASSTPGASRSLSISSLSGQRITRAKAAAARRAEAEKEKERKLTSVVLDDDLEALFAEEAEVPNVYQTSADQEVYYEYDGTPMEEGLYYEYDGTPMEEGQVYVEENSGEMMLYTGQNLVPYEDPIVYQFFEDEPMMNQQAEDVKYEPAHFDYDSDPMLCGNFEEPNDLEPIFNFEEPKCLKVDDELFPRNFFGENMYDDYDMYANPFASQPSFLDNDPTGNHENFGDPFASQSSFLDNDPTSPTFNPFTLFGEMDASAILNQTNNGNAWDWN